MARRLARGGVRVVGFDPDPAVVKALEGEGTITGAASRTTANTLAASPMP